MWRPLENTPEVLEPYLQKIGVQDASVFDLFSLEEIPEYIPRPVHALLFVFPSSGTKTIYKGSRILPKDSDKVLWYPQTIPNACGTIGLLHAVSNGGLRRKVSENDFIKSLIRTAEGSSIEERAKLIEDSKELEALHAAFAGPPLEVEGSEEDVETDLHFICFVKGKSKDDNHFYELDGRQEGPVQHSEIESDLLNAEVLSVIKNYIQSIDSPFFSLVAITTP